MLIALLAGVGAMALSVLARLLGRRSAWRRDGLLSETVLTAVPILAMAAASVVLANGVDRRFAGILLGALLLANPLVWRPASTSLPPCTALRTSMIRRGSQACWMVSLGWQTATNIRSWLAFIRARRIRCGGSG